MNLHKFPQYSYNNLPISLKVTSGRITINLERIKFAADTYE